MSRTIAQLRAEKPTARPERGVTVCLKPNLVGEVQALTNELSDLPSPKTSPRVGVGEDPRAAEIRARIAELIDEMADYQGELIVRAVDDGQWRRWTNEHPARRPPESETAESEGREGDPGWRRDIEVASGYCNADDLIDDLATYAHSWDGEPLTEGDWDVLRPSIGSADLKEIAKTVLSMHESRLDFRRWRTGLQSALSRSAGSESPEDSASAPDGSSAGSPESSTAATTETASK